jgi:hypothetical protein
MTHERLVLPEQLYHTYIIAGDPMNDPFVLRDMLISRSSDIALRTDVLCQIYDSLTVADSTFLKGWHAEGNVSDGKRICIIGTKAINREAENALLKMLEEPKERTHFFIIVPEPEMLAPTILSRAHVMRMNTGTSRSVTSARAFLSAKPSERIALIETIIKSHKDDETSGGLRYEALQLLSDIEKIIYEESFVKNKSDVDICALLEEIGKLRHYLGITGASVKMILEHLALIIPNR